MDGLVAWTSSLTGDASVQDVCSFMERFSGIPTVTIGLKVGPGIPLVDRSAPASPLWTSTPTRASTTSCAT